ncbi:MAG: hypothetical protein ACO3NE_08945 [Alphaproteobacteria bacterium]
MLKYIIGAVILVLMGLGGFINYNRERSGPCSEEYVKDYLRGELLERYLEESLFYSNLQAGLNDDSVAASSRSKLQELKTSIDAQLEAGEVTSREVSPSTRTKKTCLTRFSVNGGFVEARYNLTIEPMPGQEFAERYSKRRKNIILLEELEPGKTYNSVDVAVFSRRSFYMKEDRFPFVEYAQDYTPDEAISTGVVSEMPK